MPEHLARMDEHGFLDNFRRISGRVQAARRERYATDADVFKWIEATCYAIERDDDAGLRDRLNAVIDDVIAAQGADGYLNTWYVFENGDRRFTELSASHEFFNLGHLIYAAIAHYRTTGETALLDAAVRYADYVTGVFDPRKPEGSSGHQGLEMAMVELYRTTGGERYLDFARFLLEWSGFAERTEIEGHCVRTAYLCAGAADYYAETGDQRYADALERLWRDMVACKIYVHGGIGSRYFREDFGFPYELPALYGYSETCASIGNILWNARMLALEGDGRFADLIETVLYNALLAGVALEGGSYFYVNPLAAIGDHARQPWQHTPCCLPNIQRLLASLPGYVYGASDEGVWVHLYDQSALDWHLPDGRAVRIEQHTRYPWQGEVALVVDIEGEAPASLFLRIPGWCTSATTTVNGQPVATAALPGRYLELRRVWAPGDRVELRLPMPPQALVSDERVRDHAGCVAVRRGPLIYCLESPDHEGISVLGARVHVGDGAAASGWRVAHRDDLLEGVTVIEAEGSAAPARAEGRPLYAPLPDRAPPTEEVRLTFIPYYAWANRGLSEMTVWVPTG
jgi:DUF1680 family protein